MAFAAVQKYPRYKVSFPVAVVRDSGDVEELSVEDISLGGLFIRTRVPVPPGSVVQLKLAVAETAPSIAVVARVVHVIDLATSVSKSRAPGMGVQFDGLPPDSERLLRKFVDAIAESERKNRLRKDAARFVDPAHVQVSDERAVLARAWSDGLDQYNTLHAFGHARLGNRVNVVIGPLVFQADVVAVDESPGATLKLVDFNGWKRESLRRYIEGATARIASAPSAAPTVRPRDRLRELVAEADFLAAAGRRQEAERTLLAAHEIAPDDDEVKRQLRLIRESIEAAEAMDLLDQISRDADKRDVIQITRKAVRISASREVLRRAMRLLQRAGAIDDMIVIAEKLIAVDPEDELPLFALLQAHDERHNWPAAARAGEALLRLRPGDPDLEARVRRIIEVARAS